MKRPTVSAGVARSFVDYAQARGAERAVLLKAVDLDEADLADQDARLPLERYRAIIRAAQNALDDPAFVLNHAMDTRLQDMSVVGLIVHSSRDMADSLTQLNRYSKLMVEVDVMDGAERFSVEPGPEGVWIVDNRPDPNSFIELTEASFGRFESEFRREFPDKPFARKIEVTHSAPAYAARYDEVFGCEVVFGAARNALLIAPDWLTQEFDSHSGYVFGLFTERAEALLAALAADETLTGRIEALLLPDLHKGEISVEAVATGLGMSRQTLYRRLKAEGTTFAAVHDGLRRRMAADYLAARKVSVNETAYLVGFSEASSFVRAFRRWTGQTPAEFRATTPGPV